MIRVNDTTYDSGAPLSLTRTAARFGYAIFDERVGLSHTTGQITHHTGPDVDAERDYLFHDLQQTGDLSEFYIVPGFHKILEGINGGGDSWHTDGKLYVGVIATTMP
jgi:hypothetical protein